MFTRANILARRYNGMCSVAVKTVLFNSFYGRPLEAGDHVIFCQCFYLFIYFLWPPYSPALVNGGSRKFYTW